MAADRLIIMKQQASSGVRVITAAAGGRSYTFVFAVLVYLLYGSAGVRVITVAAGGRSYKENNSIEWFLVDPSELTETIGYCIFILSVYVSKEIEKIMRGFLWNQGVMQKEKAKVKWQDVCSLKIQGGLGIESLDTWNIALISKHVWNLVSRKNSLWVKWIKSYRLIDRRTRDMNDKMLWLSNNGKVGNFSVKAVWSDLILVKPVVPCLKIKVSAQGLQAAEIVEFCKFSGKWRVIAQWSDELVISLGWRGSWFALLLLMDSNGVILKKWEILNTGVYNLEAFLLIEFDNYEDLYAKTDDNVLSQLMP
ncbi:hypothetical protein Tco_0570601 [Tanacetum coccineum]